MQFEVIQSEGNVAGYLSCKVSVYNEDDKSDLEIMSASAQCVNYQILPASNSSVKYPGLIESFINSPRLSPRSLFKSNKRDHLKDISQVTAPHIVASNLSLKASSMVQICVEEEIPDSWLPTYHGTILHFKTALRLDIKYFKKHRASSSSASTNSSSVLKTEWFPINVLPNYVPKEIQVRNNLCNRPSEDDDDDSEHLLFNRNNPFLQGESCQKVDTLLNNHIFSSRASTAFFARIRNSSGLEVAKVSLLRTLLKPGENIVGTLDFRGSNLAAAAAFGMNLPGKVIFPENCDKGNIVSKNSQVSIDPYICSEYSVSLVAREKVNEDEDYLIENADLSPLSLDIPPRSPTRLSKSISMDHLSLQSCNTKSSRKKPSKNEIKEFEIRHATTADIVVGTDVVGFRLQIPKDTTVPTFNSSIGNLSWKIEFEFVLSPYRMLLPQKRSETNWRAPDKLPVRTLKWSTPIIIHGTG